MDEPIVKIFLGTCESMWLFLSINLLNKAIIGVYRLLLAAQLMVHHFGIKDHFLVSRNGAVTTVKACREVVMSSSCARYMD
jgi:hypothetical protein